MVILKTHYLNQNVNFVDFKKFIIRLKIISLSEPDNAICVQILDMSKSSQIVQCILKLYLIKKMIIYKQCFNRFSNVLNQTIF